MSEVHEEQILLDYQSAGNRLSVGRTTIYGLVGRGEICSVKIGRRSLITRASLDAYVDRLAEAADKGSESNAPSVSAVARARVCLWCGAKAGDPCLETSGAKAYITHNIRTWPNSEPTQRAFAGMWHRREINEGRMTR